jgi:hypothetical protein
VTDSCVPVIIPSLGSAVKYDASILNIDVTIIDGSAILPQMVGEEAICLFEESIAFSIALPIGDSHHTHIAGVHILEAALSAEKVDIGIDLVDGCAKVNVDVLSSIAMGDVTGEYYTAVTEALIPADAMVLAFQIAVADMKVDIYPGIIIPVHKETEGVKVVRQTIGNTAANEAALCRFVIAVKLRHIQIEFRHCQCDLLVLQHGVHSGHMRLE